MNRPDWRRELLLATVVFGGAAVVLGMSVLLSARSGLPLGALSRDVASTAGLDPLIGLQSNIGVLVWWAGGAVALFGWAVSRGVADPRRALLGWLGLLTALLAADDLLLIHEALAPRYLGLGEKPMLLLYATSTAAILLRHAHTIIRSRGVLVFAAGLSCLALSVLVDLFQACWTSEWRVFTEDGFKLLGIVGWTGFLLQLAGDTLRAHVRHPQIERSP